MKIKALSALLLIGLLAPLASTYFSYYWQKHQIRRTVKWQIIAGLDRSELVHLRFSVAELNKKVKWKHAAEFEFQGEFYDIVEKEVCGDSIHFWLWWDREETALYQKLLERANTAINQNANQKEQNQRLVDFFKSLFYYESGTLKVKQNLADQKAIYFLVCILPHPVLYPPSPPPRELIS